MVYWTFSLKFKSCLTSWFNRHSYAWSLGQTRFHCHYLLTISCKSCWRSSCATFPKAQPQLPPPTLAPRPPTRFKCDHCDNSSWSLCNVQSNSYAHCYVQSTWKYISLSLWCHFWSKRCSMPFFGWHWVPLHTNICQITWWFFSCCLTIILFDSQSCLQKMHKTSTNIRRIFCALKESQWHYMCIFGWHRFKIIKIIIRFGV